MYNQKDIEKNLVEFNYFIDEATLSQFIKNWKIDAIYEDEDGVEFYDNLAISKLKKGISLKSQGYTNDQIIYHINKLLPEKLAAQEKEKQEKEEQERSQQMLQTQTVSVQAGGDLKNITVDVTHQTLQMLADTVAQKITNDIKDKILCDTSLQKDNEELAKKVEELTEDNKILAKRVEELEKARRSSLINVEFLKNIFR